MKSDIVTLNLKEMAGIQDMHGGKRVDAWRQARGEHYLLRPQRTAGQRRLPRNGDTTAAV